MFIVHPPTMASTLDKTSRARSIAADTARQTVTKKTFKLIHKHVFSRCRFVRMQALQRRLERCRLFDLWLSCMAAETLYSPSPTQQIAPLGVTNPRRLLGPLPSHRCWLTGAQVAELIGSRIPDKLPSFQLRRPSAIIPLPSPPPPSIKLVRIPIPS